MPLIAGFGMLIHTKSRRTFFENKPDALQGYYIEDSKQLALF